jgi:hypothetical protein
MLQPSSSAPMRFSTGTRTSSKNTWFSSCSPDRLVIGATVRSGLAISIKRKVRPCWRFSRIEVRTMANMRSARCAPVVQILAPVTRQA